MGMLIVLFCAIGNEWRKKTMPRTKGESVFFTAITAWMMVYVMTLYNTVLASGSFHNETFLIALKGMWVEYIIIFLLAYFVSGKIAKYFAFRVVEPGDRPIAIIFATLFAHLLQKLCYGTAVTTAFGRTTGKNDF